MSEIWASSGPDALCRLEGDVYRLVESQAQVATRFLDLSLEQQAELEDLLEASKPPLPAAGPTKLHYLLLTPFRYPPLPYGSRFGGRHEPSLFYGSSAVPTVLAESAYYRLVFLSGMDEPPKKSIQSQHTLFRAVCASDKGIRLHRPPFDAWSEKLTDRCSYSATQALGSAMRESGVEAFQFTSARDPEAGLNVALFTPKAFASTAPEMTQDWWAETTSSMVSFYRPKDERQYFTFPRSVFLVDGALPTPAT